MGMEGFWSEWWNVEWIGPLTHLCASSSPQCKALSTSFIPELRAKEDSTLTQQTTCCASPRPQKATSGGESGWNVCLLAVKFLINPPRFLRFSGKQFQMIIPKRSFHYSTCFQVSAMTEYPETNCNVSLPNLHTSPPRLPLLFPVRSLYLC